MTFIINFGIFRVKEVLDNPCDEYNILTINESWAAIGRTTQEEAKKVVTIQPKMEMSSGRVVVVDLQCEEKYAVAIQEFIEKAMKSSWVPFEQRDKDAKKNLIWRWDKLSEKQAAREDAVGRERIAQEENPKDLQASMQQVSLQSDAKGDAASGDNHEYVAQSFSKLNPLPKTKKQKIPSRDVEITKGLEVIFRALYPTSEFTSDLTVLEEKWMEPFALSKNCAKYQKLKGKMRVFSIPVTLPSNKIARVTLQCEASLEEDIKKFMNKVFPKPTIILDKEDQAILEEFTNKLEALASEQEKQQKERAQKLQKKKPHLKLIWVDRKTDGEMSTDTVKCKEFFVVTGPETTKNETQ